MRTRIITADVPVEVAEIHWPAVGEANPLCSGPRPREVRQDPGEQGGEAEARLRAAFDEGFRQGQGDAQARLQAEIDARLAELAHGIEAAAGLKARLRAEAERDVVELALAIARRVLRRQLSVDPEALLGLVKAAFEGISQAEVTAVRVPPAFEGPVRRHLEAIGAPQAIEVAADASLGAGGLAVETTRGTLDASVGTQLDEIGRGLADLLPAGRGRR